MKSIQKYADDPRVARFMPDLPHPYTLDDARKWINYTRRTARNDSVYFFGIEYHQTGEIVGMMGLQTINHIDNNAEIGYWVGRPVWGKRLATESLQLLLEFAFRTVKLRRAYAIVHSTNHTSVKLLESAGFVLEATWRKASKIGRSWGDVFGFGMLKDEYRPMITRGKH